MLRFTCRAALGLALALGVASAAPAGDLTMVQDRTGRYFAYALGLGGFHQEPIDLGHVSSVQVGGAMARLTSGNVTLLVGAARSGVVLRRIDQELGGTVSSFVAGDRLALASGRHGWVAYGVGAEGIAAVTLQGHVSTVRVAGDMAYVHVGGRHLLLAAAPSGVVHLDLGTQSPSRIELARGQALTSWSSGNVYLHVPAHDGIHSVDLSRTGRPRRIWLGGTAAEAPGGAD